MFLYQKWYMYTGSFIQKFNEYVKIYWLQIQVISIRGYKYYSTQRSIPSSFDSIQFQDISIQVIYSIPSSVSSYISRLQAQFQDISIQVILFNSKLYYSHIYVFYYISVDWMQLQKSKTTITNRRKNADCSNLQDADCLRSQDKFCQLQY